MNIPWKKIGKLALSICGGWLIERSRKKLPKALTRLLDGVLNDTPETPAELKDALHRLLDAKVAAQVEAALDKGKSLAARATEAALARDRGGKR